MRFKQRKARWLTTCFAATKPISIDGNIWSEVNRSHITQPFRLCEPSRRGLIVGLMDKHYPVLYLNAVAARVSRTITPPAAATEAKAKRANVSE